jgi:NAD(P)H-flavin reductase
MNVSPCFDAGSTYCPCILAELGECVACSLLRGEETCTCGWSGLCIYSEFIRSGKRGKPKRRAIAASILRRREITEGPPARAFIFQAEVPEELSLWCELPGSFVLLRPKGSPERFNVPISVMASQATGITLAVQVVGPKTIALERACKEGKEVTLVGPFWSGLQGLEHLKSRSSGNVLIVAKGIAQASAVQAAKYVTGMGGAVKALLGAGPIDRIFAQEEIERTGAVLEVLPKAKDHNLTRVFSELTANRYDVLMSAGGNIQHRALKKLLEGIQDPPAFVWTSSLSMTCAEGICGSCLAGGLRGCKAHLPDGV